MAYPFTERVPDVRPGRQPPSVVVAVVFQGICAFVMLVAVVFVVIGYVRTEEAITKAARLVEVAVGDVDDAREFNLVFTVALVLVEGILALWLAVPIRWFWRGSELARMFAAVAAWLLGALGIMLILCVGLSVVMALAALAGGGMTDPEPVASLDAASRFEDAVDTQMAVWGLLSLLCVCLASVLALVAAVALVVPASNRWYRSRAQAPQVFMAGPYAQPAPMRYQR